MDTLARETFGFNGYFTSDCDAIYEIQAGHHWQPPKASAPLDQYGRTAFANSAGEDLDCNAGYSDQYNYGNTIPTAIAQHITTQTDVYNVGDVDTSVVRLFTARIETGEFDAESPGALGPAARARLGGTTWVQQRQQRDHRDPGTGLRRHARAPTRASVLLKNSPDQRQRRLLPLKVPLSGAYKVAVVGYFATPERRRFSSVATRASRARPGRPTTSTPTQGIKSAVQAD